MPSASETIAAFAADMHFDVLPAAVVAKMKLHVLDLLGVALAASSMDFAPAVASVAQGMGGPPEATAIGLRQRLPAPWAALVNGTLAHGLDYDDTHAESVVHVSASVVPAALAACEAASGDGCSFLNALALGMEVNVRLGLVAPGAFHDRGFHPTGVCGAFAAALVAGKIAGLSSARLADALGLAGSQAAGLMEFLTDGTAVKRVHPGWAAHSGLLAARLAAAGVTGPRGVLDGRFGLYRSHLGDGEWDLSALTSNLGTRWHLLDISLKPYPCCHMNHAFIDCAAALQAQHGLAPESIEQIDCFIHPREAPVVCEPLPSKHTPQNGYDAKFSLPYAVASQFVRGHVAVDDFTAAAIREPAVLALARRVACHDDASNAYPRYFPGWMRVRLRDGRVLEHHEPINRGHAERPLSAAAVHEKFRRNAALATSAAAAEALAAAVTSLDAAPDLSRVVAPLRSAMTEAHRPS
jgi:2-methylcitrate dehydratase PrpD